MKALLQKWLGIYLRGFAIGIAEVIPGISGGTIAFISGIYTRLLVAISHFDWQWIKNLWHWSRGQVSFRSVIQPVDAGFLVALVLGMASALLLTAHWVRYLMQHHSLLIWGWLFGLIIAAIISIAIKAGRIQATTWPLIGLGFLAGYSLSTLPLPEPTLNPALIMAAGAMAGCAWVLPGISGSFLLLVLGFYQHFITALAHLDLSFLAPFGIGVAIGLPIFSRILSRWLQAYRGPTLWFLLAFMASALKQVWPWQQVLSYYYLGENQAIPLATLPVMPDTYLEMTGNSPEVISVVALIALGVGCLVLIDRLTSDQKVG